MPFIPWLLVSILYFPVFLYLYKQGWEILDYSHAYFILPISLLIIWLKRKELRSTLTATEPKPQHPLSPSLLLIVASLLFFILGWRWEYNFVQAFSLIPLCCGLLLYLYGKKVFRKLLFPILYLLLLVPIPIGVLDNVTIPMRYLSSFISAGILKVFGYNIHREGLVMMMGDHEIFMGAPCSGFRSLITMISLGLIYIYFLPSKIWKNLILFVSIFPLALIGNVTRIIAICLITYYFGDEAGQGFFHGFSGALVFVIIILGLIIIEKLLNKNA